MASATTTPGDLQNSTTRGVDDSFAIRIFQLASSLSIFVFLALLVSSERAALDGRWSQIALWAAVALAADLMLVRVGKGVTLTMSLPVSLAAALLFPPAFAAIVAFAGCFDPMEVHGESSFSRAVFNRSQVALATTAAALVFQVGNVNAAAWPAVALWSLIALAADFAVNAACVVPTIVLRDRVSLSHGRDGTCSGQLPSTVRFFTSRWACRPADRCDLPGRGWVGSALLPRSACVGEGRPRSRRKAPRGERASCHQRRGTSQNCRIG